MVRLIWKSHNLNTQTPQASHQHTNSKWIEKSNQIPVYSEFFFLHPNTWIEVENEIFHLNIIEFNIRSAIERERINEKLYAVWFAKGGQQRTELQKVKEKKKKKFVKWFLLCGLVVAGVNTHTHKHKHKYKYTRASRELQKTYKHIYMRERKK